MGEGQTIQWQTDNRKNEQTMTYNTLHIKLRIDNEVEIHSALYICFIAYNFDSTHTKSLHRIILIEINFLLVHGQFTTTFHWS